MGGANLAAMARRAYACAAVGGASVPCVCAHHSTGAMGAGEVAGAGAGPGLAPELLRRGGSAWFAAVRSARFTFPGSREPGNFPVPKIGNWEKKAVYHLLVGKKKKFTTCR